MDRGAWRATVDGITRVGHDLVLSFFLRMINSTLTFEEDLPIRLEALKPEK